MILGAQPQITQMPAQQPLQGAPAQTSPMVQALMAGMATPSQQSSVPAEASGLNMGMLAQMFAKNRQDQQASGLLGGAIPGAPSWLNAARFGMSGAQGVNPWTYGTGGQAGGGAAPGATQPTDSAGNFQV